MVAIFIKKALHDGLAQSRRGPRSAVETGMPKSPGAGRDRLLGTNYRDFTVLMAPALLSRLCPGVPYPQYRSGWFVFIIIGCVLLARQTYILLDDWRGQVCTWRAVFASIGLSAASGCLARRP